MHRHIFYLVLGISTFSMITLTHGENWPRFLGPNGNGISSETGLADEWPEEGPKELWSFDVGEGFGAPAIVDNKVYVLDRVNDQKDVMRCFDLNSGDELWSFGYDAPGRLSYDGSRSTPLVDEGNVYSVGPFGDVYCFSLETHEPVWNLSLTEDFGGNPPNWGYSHSPILHGNHVIVAPMSNSAGLVALDKQSGEVVWKSPDVGGDAYTTPVVNEIDGIDQILFLSKTHLSGINSQTGELLWSWDGYQCKIPIPSPTPLGDGKFFLSGGYDAGSVLVQVKKDGDVWSVNELHRMDENGSQIHQVALYEDHLYANFNTNENLRGRNPMGMVCLDLQGNILWSTKDDPSVNRGGFIIADEKIFVMGGENGVLYLLEATPQQVNVMDSALIFDDLKRRDNNIWAPLTLSNGKLLVRNQSKLKCLNVNN